MTNKYTIYIYWYTLNSPLPPNSMLGSNSIRFQCIVSSQHWYRGEGIILYRKWLDLLCSFASFGHDCSTNHCYILIQDWKFLLTTTLSSLSVICHFLQFFMCHSSLSAVFLHPRCQVHSTSALPFSLFCIPCTFSSLWLVVCLLFWDKSGLGSSTATH